MIGDEARGVGLVALVLLLIGSDSARAQEPTDLGESFAVERWTIAEGLPQSTVSGLEQTRDGYLWLTTFGGVVRFDGVHFTVFDLASHPTLGGHRFVGLEELADGDLYLAIQDLGLTRHRAGVFTPVEVPGAPRGPVVGPIADGRGTAWAMIGGTLIGLGSDGVQAEPIGAALEDRWVSLQVDAAGALWLATPRGVACLRGPCEAPRQVVPATEAWLASVSRTRSGGRWYAEWGPPPGCPTPPAGLPWIRSFEWRGRRWCAVGRQLISGSTRLDLGARAAWETHDVIEVTSTLEDREGALWVGTSGGGLFQIRSRELERFGMGRGLTGRSVWGLVEDHEGRVWASSWDGLRWIEGGHVRTPTPAIAELLPLSALAVDGEGRAWLASEKHGLHRVEDGVPRPRAEGAGRRVRALFFEASGALWLVVAGEDLTRWESGAPTARITAEALGGDALVMREAPDGALWFGTGGGVARVEGARAGAPTVRRITPADGLAPGAIRDLYLDPNGSVWAGSYGGGLSRIKGGAIARISRDEGLCDNVASRIIPDGAGMLWINGNRGVYSVRSSDLEDVADRKHTHLQCALFEAGEGNGNSGFRGRDGRVWFPTITGVVAIDPVTPSAAVAPIPHIERISVAGRPILPGAKVPSGADLTVEMTALSFADPRGLFFRHQLRNYDAEPVAAGATRVARYTRLPPGHYRFELEARSVRGVWSEKVSFPFTVEPRFYERRRFYVLAAAIVLALLWGLATIRTRTLERHNRALRRSIEERERVTAALRAEEAHYRALFERTSDGLFIHRPDGTLIEVNSAGCSMVGRSREALLSGPPLHYVTPEARAAYRAMLSGVVSGAPVGRVESSYVGADGAPVAVRLQGAQLDDYEPQHVLICAVDLSAERNAERERRDLESQLRQSQKLEALGQLAGGIAHDFNNLLTAIGVQASLLRGADTDDLEAISGIQSTVKRAAALTKKLLVFGTKDLHDPQVVDVHERLEELMGVLRRTVPADVVISLTHHAASVRIKVDPVRLEQTIINLVVNARDATGGAGSIAITTEEIHVEADEAARRGVTPGPFAVISVADDGSGMDEAIVERIFEPFFTTKPVGKGSGLGLAIVHGVMREAGGFVTVESRRGRGTTFRLHFPRVDTPIDRPETLDLAPPRADGLTVLLCDDEPLLRSVAARALRSAGYRVLEAATADDAIEIARAETRNVRVLITDVVMPEMNGPDLAKRVRSIIPDLPVLFVSGHTRDVVVERGVINEAEFLSKPFTVNMLVRRVGALVARTTPSHGIPTPPGV